MLTIFISYSWKDQRFVNSIVKKLEDYNVKIWKDEYRISGGDSIIGEIGNGLDESEFFIPILSPNSIKSKYVKKEISVASTLELENKIKIIPLMYKKCDKPTILVDKLCLDFSNSNKRKKEFHRLTTMLGLIQEPMPREIKELIDRVFNLDVYGLSFSNDLWAFNTYLINNLFYNIFTKFYMFDSYLCNIWSEYLLNFDNELINRVTKYISDLKSNQKSKYEKLPELWKRWENNDISIGNVGLGVENTDFKLTKEKLIDITNELIDKDFVDKLGRSLFNDFFKDYWETYYKK